LQGKAEKELSENLREYGQYKEKKKSANDHLTQTTGNAGIVFIFEMCYNSG